MNHYPIIMPQERGRTCCFCTQCLK